MKVVAELLTYNEVCTQLGRHQSVRCTPVPDPLCLQDKLNTRLRGREVEEGNPAHGERFLIYSCQGGRLQVFCADTELAVLYQTEYVIYGGTFETAPDSAYQVYMVHGFRDSESAAGLGTTA